MRKKRDHIAEQNAIHKAKDDADMYDKKFL